MSSSGYLLVHMMMLTMNVINSVSFRKKIYQRVKSASRRLDKHYFKNNSKKSAIVAYSVAGAVGACECIFLLPTPNTS